MKRHVIFSSPLATAFRPFQSSHIVAQSLWQSRQASRRTHFPSPAQVITATTHGSEAPKSVLALAGLGLVRGNQCTSIEGPIWRTHSTTSIRKRPSIRHQVNERRAFSTSASLRDPPADKPKVPRPDNISEKKPPIQPPTPDHGAANEHHNYHLLDRLPHIHRPTKEELLAAATGFWQRLGIRFKWFSIRSVRPWNTDDISAFISWIFLGHIIWIIVGTTTFFSLLILALNTVFAQETLAGWVGNYLTSSSGLKVVFESAIVPKWGDGVITFRNVFVSRRPGQGKANVRKGSLLSAAAEAAAARAKEEAELAAEELEDLNYTQFDLSFDTINVSLSFTKWFNGKGLLRDVDIKGVRGVVDRTNVQPGDPDIDPKSYRHEHNTGDFEIDNFKLEDFLVTIYQPNNFRPFSVSIYSCELPRLRKQYLFYDMMSANTMSGSFDDSLFTIHPRQAHNHTGLQIDDTTGEAGLWKKHSRIRIDGLNIDHMNRGVEGPFSWIHEGNVDIVADIMFPADEDGSIAKVMSDFYDRMEATVTNNGYIHTTHQHDTRDHHDDERPDPPPPNDEIADQDDRFIIMDLKIHLNDVRAAVPLFTHDISYVNNALVRPIIAYINSKRAFIPVNCRVVKRISEFDGSWTIFDSGLLHDLSRETYEAFARDIVDDKARTRRLKKVGIWTIQLAAQALFIGLAGQLA